MRRTVLVSLTATIIIIAISCGKDPGPSVCQPHALNYDTDSVVYSYVDGRVTTVLYYGSGRQNYQDDLTYNSTGQLVVIVKSALTFEGELVLQSQHVIDYGEDGRPDSLVTNSSSGYFTTNFTHNELGQLALAQTTSGIGQRFLGSTRYEYDADGNIPKVYYTIRINQNITEVLARENLSFDGKEKFYKDNEELKIIYQYVYGYLPNKNNCLSATVHYYSYAQHFSSPLSLNFIATYDNEGLIKSLQIEGPNNSPYSGEVLFNNASYDCR